MSSVSDNVPIWLTLIRIEFGDALVDALLEALDVRHEQVVADELHAVAEQTRERCPTVPVVLGHAVFDRHDRVAAAQVGQPVGELGGAVLGAFARKHVAPVPIELGRREVERERDLLAGLVPRGLDGREQQLQRFFVRREIRRETTFVTDRRREAALVAAAPSARGRSRRPSGALPRSSRHRRARGRTPASRRCCRRARHR